MNKKQKWIQKIGIFCLYKKAKNNEIFLIVKITYTVYLHIKKRKTKYIKSCTLIIGNTVISIPWL